MIHPTYRVVSFVIVAPYTLRVTFDDTTTQTIDFAPILEGELYSPLRDASLFNQVQLDQEVHTLVWPNGADFDPATLHDWPEHLEGMKALARQWALTPPEARQGARAWPNHALESTPTAFARASLRLSARLTAGVLATRGRELYCETQRNRCDLAWCGATCSRTVGASLATAGSQARGKPPHREGHLV